MQDAGVCPDPGCLPLPPPTQDGKVCVCCPPFPLPRPCPEPGQELKIAPNSTCDEARGALKVSGHLPLTPGCPSPISSWFPSLSPFLEPLQAQTIWVWFCFGGAGSQIQGLMHASKHSTTELFQSLLVLFSPSHTIIFYKYVRSA